MSLHVYFRSYIFFLYAHSTTDSKFAELNIFFFFSSSQECISFENMLDDQQDDSMSATVVGQIMGSSNLYDELNINLDNFPPECNVDEVIKHEVSLGGCLDFNNFNPPIQPQPSVTTTQTLASVNHDQSSFASGHHWVH